MARLSFPTWSTGCGRLDSHVYGSPQVPALVPRVSTFPGAGSRVALTQVGMSGLSCLGPDRPFNGNRFAGSTGFRARMTKRNLRWIRQHTNVEDLLDDGIENNSDLRSFASDDDTSEEQPLPTSNDSSPTAQDSGAPAIVADRNPISAFGVMLGGSMMWFGVKLFLYPVDTFVYHARAKSLHRGVLEHVTQAGSHFYGIVGFLTGLAILLCSVYRPRR